MGLRRDKCGRCEGWLVWLTQVEQGIAGWRCQTCGLWIYPELHRQPGGGRVPTESYRPQQYLVLTHIYPVQADGLTVADPRTQALQTGEDQNKTGVILTVWR